MDLYWSLQIQRLFLSQPKGLDFLFSWKLLLRMHLSIYISLALCGQYEVTLQLSLSRGFPWVKNDNKKYIIKTKEMEGVVLARKKDKSCHNNVVKLFISFTLIYLKNYSIKSCHNYTLYPFLKNRHCTHNYIKKCMYILWICLKTGICRY